MNEHHIYTFKQLAGCIHDKSYRLANKISFKSLRHQKLHYIRNHERRVWIPVSESAMQELMVVKHILCDYINCNEFVFYYTYKPEIDDVLQP